MKWYSVKKYKPPTDASCFGICIDGAGYTNIYIVCWKEDKKSWEVVDDSKDSTKNDKMEDIDFIITHFCIPDPIEIEG